jgi:hypothetical protein
LFWELHWQAHLFDYMHSPTDMIRKCSGVPDAQMAICSLLPVSGSVYLKYAVSVLVSSASWIGFCLETYQRGEFLPLILHLHSMYLSPLGTDFAPDILLRVSHNWVPWNKAL